MNTHEATKKASLLGGKVMIMQGIAEILDTQLSMDHGDKVGTPAWEKAEKSLQGLYHRIEALEEERDLYWSYAKADD